MNGRDFSLHPFAPLGPPFNFTMTGQLARSPRHLAIRYDLNGPLAELVIPAPAPLPVRRHGLWEKTCFEFFLGLKHSPLYWEFNLSPSGDWNVYRFTGYRRGMTEETAFTSLPFNVKRQSDSLHLALDLNLDEVIPADQPLEIGIAAVIKFASGELTYWALTHPGPQADFHRRDSFLVEL